MPRRNPDRVADHLLTEAAVKYQQVLARCLGRCECAGACGTNHKLDRCSHNHTSKKPLTAYSPEARWVDAAAAGADRLTALCPACLAGTKRKLRDLAAPEPQEGLFDA